MRRLCLVLLLTATTAGAQSVTVAVGQPIAVGSKAFTESVILGEIVTRRPRTRCSPPALFDV